MKNGDVLKWFIREHDTGVIEHIVNMLSDTCPNDDFLERFPCDTHSDCHSCWRTFLELDDGLVLSISPQEDGDAE